MFGGGIFAFYNIVKLNCFDYFSPVFGGFMIFLRNIWAG